MASVANSKTARTSSLAVVATDGELLMRFDRHRDQAAFAEVVERHGRLVWIICNQALRHHQDVEDAFQATFLILAQRATTIRASDSAAAWLYRVAQRTAIAARRRRSRLREEELVAEPPQGEEALPLFHDQQMMHVLMEELQSLPEKYQTPLVMQYFEGQSRRAIAEQTDSTLAQIQGRLVRGKRMLRSRLIRRGVSLSLATGAVAAANTSASAAVSPSLVAATAASSSSIIASGTAGAVSAAAVELSKQGLNAMWYTSVTKVATVAATLIVGLGVAWAAGQPGGDGVGVPNVSVELQQGVDSLATAEAGEDTAIGIEVAAAEPAKAGTTEQQEWDVADLSPARQIELERNHWLQKAKAYRMKAGLMRAAVENTGGPESGLADAMLLEADASMAEAKAIELARQMAGAAPGAQEVAGAEVKVFSLVNSDVSTLIDILRTQFGAGLLKFSADARTNRIVATGPPSELAVVEALLLRLDSEGDQQQEYAQKLLLNKSEQARRNFREVSQIYIQLRTELERLKVDNRTMEAEVELLGKVREDIATKLRAVESGERASDNKTMQALTRALESLTKQMSDQRDKLVKSSVQAAEAEAKVNFVKEELSAKLRLVEFLDRLQLQNELSPHVPLSATSVEPRELRATTSAPVDVESKVSQLEAENARLQQEIVQLNTTREAQRTLMAKLQQAQAENAELKRGGTGQPAAAAQFGEMINDIMQENIRLNSELNELRKKVDELQQAQAENAELMGQAGTTDALTDPNNVTGGIVTDTFAPAQLTLGQFQNAAAAQFDQLHQMVTALQKENEALKQQIEELRKAQPASDK